MSFHYVKVLGLFVHISRVFTMRSLTTLYHFVLQAFDKDGSGYIDKQELGSTIESLGIHMTKMDVEAMLASDHTRKDGRIYYEGWHLTFAMLILLSSKALERKDF